MPHEFTASAVISFALTLAAFWIPGICWACVLHRRAVVMPTFLAVHGVACSLAVFALVAWPFLWWQLPFRDFLRVLEFTWLGYAGGGILLCWLGRLASRGAGSQAALPPMLDLIPEPARLNPWRDASILAAYVGTAALIAAIPHWTLSSTSRERATTWLVHGMAIMALLSVACLMIWRLAPRLSDLLSFSAEDYRRPPRWILVLAVLGILAQTLSSMVFVRPDWDDCYYLAAVLDYQHADALNAAEPTHREGFPVSPINRLLAWELWGAVLCHFSGLNPMVVFHTLLPGILVPLAYAAYWQLLRELLPPRWVPLAVLGIVVYHTWGISSHDTPANYLVTRIAQGKAVLLHLAIPMVMVLLIRFVQRPAGDTWISLLAAVLFGLAASSSAVFLEIMLIGCLTGALLIVGRPHRWPLIAMAATATALPPLLYGLLLRNAVLVDPAITPQNAFGWNWQTWFYIVGGYAWGGTAELIWMLTLPVLALLLRNRASVAVLVVYPLVLGLTFGNPLVADPVARFVTSYPTYFRTFWLYPVAVGLSALVALLARMGGRLLSRPGSTAPQTAESSWSEPVGLLGLLLTLLLPGFYVWGERNTQMISAGGSHPLAQNVLKMPADLVALAGRLLADEQVSSHRLLCPESISSFLTPYSTRFRFVQTRFLYTLYMADQAGRRQEGEKRYLLSLILSGYLPDEDGAPAAYFKHPHYDIGPIPNPPQSLDAATLSRWLDELRVRYAITDSKTRPTAHPKLSRLGFRVAGQFGSFTLWERDMP